MGTRIRRRRYREEGFLLNSLSASTFVRAQTIIHSLTLERHGLEGGMDRDLLGGVELHPLIRLAIDTAAFSHVVLLWASRLMKLAN